MPRVNYCNPDNLGKGKNTQEKKSSGRPSASRKQLERDIVSLFGMCLTLADLMSVLGLKDRACARNWIQSEGIEPVLVNGRKRYLATDVAKALDNSKLRASAV